MASLNNFEESLSSIAMHSYVSIITLFTNIAGIIHLYLHFRNNNTEITGYLKLTYFPFISWISMSLIFMALNNYTFTELNNTFSLIDTYCDILCKMMLNFAEVLQQSLSIFLLTRIEQTFKSTPSKVKWYEYNTQIFISVFLCIFVAIVNPSAIQPTIYIAADNPDYKLCHIDFQMSDGQATFEHNIWIPIAVFSGDIYLFYLFCSKFRKYQIRADQLNESINPKAKHLKLTAILFIIAKYLIKPVIFGVFMVFKIKYVFTIRGIIDCFIMLYCVDSNVFTNNEAEIEQEESEEELERRLQEIMRKYYAPPHRLSLQEMESNNNDDSIPLIQIEGH